jgi:hypothetical protein
MRLSAVLPPIRMWYNLTLEMMGVTTSGSCLAPAMFLGQSEASKPVVRCLSWRWQSFCQHPAHLLNDAPGRDVPGATIQDVELLAALVGVGVRVGVAVDNLQCPFSVLECHLLVLLLVILLDNLLLAFLAPRGHAIATRLLLLLLTELLCKLLDFSALLCAVAPSVVHWAPQTILITTGGLSQPLVTMWAMAPTGHCRSTSDSWSTSQRLVVAVSLLLLPFVL